MVQKERRKDDYVRKTQYSYILNLLVVQKQLRETRFLVEEPSNKSTLTSKTNALKVMR